MNVFLSWSGQTSKEVAEIFKNWLPNVLQLTEPFYSKVDIAKGEKWNQKITEKLESTDIGIVLITKTNYDSPWVLFESGALSKISAKSIVCPIMFGLKLIDYDGPLKQFQCSEYNKEDIKNVVASINAKQEIGRLNSVQLDSVFEMWWPQLKEKIDKALTKEVHVTIPERSQTEILEEILINSRKMLKSEFNRIESSDQTSIIFDIDWMLKHLNELIGVGCLVKSSEAYDLYETIVSDIYGCLKENIKNIRDTERRDLINRKFKGLISGLNSEYKRLLDKERL